MAEIPIYQVDAFTERVFGGNPAAVCPLPNFLSDDLMQAIALENNLSETAFIVPRAIRDEADYDLRWFTPATEVDLCGHATLGAAYVVLNALEPDLTAVRFMSRSGLLAVARDGDRLVLDFPNLVPGEVVAPSGLNDAMGGRAEAVYHRDRDYMLVYKSRAQVEALVPNLESLKAFAPYGFLATAPGDADDPDGPDFISRCFFPNHGIAEDPVTGSAHCLMAPYWAQRLGRETLYAQQLSARGGALWLTVKSDRVEIAGQAVEVMRGILFV